MAIPQRGGLKKCNRLIGHIPYREYKEPETARETLNIMRDRLTGTLVGCIKSTLHASVAQLDRASVFGTEGWGFESLRVYLETLFRLRVGRRLFVR